MYGYYQIAGHINIVYHATMERLYAMVLGQGAILINIGVVATMMSIHAQDVVSNAQVVWGVQMF